MAPGAQLSMYYGSSAGPRDYSYVAGNVAFYAAQFERVLGPATWVLLAVGIAIALRREWRAWIPRLLHVAVTVAVMSTPHLVFKRLLLPSMGVVLLVAATPLAWVAKRSRVLAVVGVLLVALPPLRGSIGYANVAARASTMDGVLDWVEANVPVGSRILDTRLVANPGMAAGMVLGVDPREYELVRVPFTEDARNLALLVRDVDLVLTPTGAHWPWEERLRLVYRGLHVKRPQEWWGLGEPQKGIGMLRVQAPAVRGRYRPVELTGATVLASENENVGFLTDGNEGTAWRSAEPMVGDEWIEVRFDGPVAVGRVEMVLGYAPERHGPEVLLLVQREDGEFAEVRRVEAHAKMLEQLRERRRGSTRPFRQRFLLEAEPVIGLRILQTGRRGAPWSIAELRVDVDEGDEPATAIDAPTLERKSR